MGVSVCAQKGTVTGYSSAVTEEGVRMRCVQVLVVSLQTAVLSAGMGRVHPEKELLAKYLLQRLLEKEEVDDSSVVYPEYDYSDDEEEILESENSQVVPTFVPAPKPRPTANTAPQPAPSSQFSMPLVK